MTYIEVADLNLLIPLRALLEERHVSRAADRARVSQPAMSQALKRLRLQLDDELLVRGSDGYQLTPRAERLLRQLTDVMPEVEAIFAPLRFDPGTAEEAFRVACTDFGIDLFGAFLFRILARESPDSTLHVEPWHDSVIDDIERGVLDLAFYGVEPPQSFRSERIYADRYVCLVSADHPLARRKWISLPAYVAARHAVVSTSNERDAIIDRRLDHLGQRRRASLTVPSYGAAASAAAETFLVATLPERLASRHADDSRLSRLSAPREIQRLDYHMAWHPRLDGDPARRWLRQVVRDAIADVTAPRSPKPTGT